MHLPTNVFGAFRHFKKRFEIAVLFNPRTIILWFVVKHCYNDSHSKKCWLKIQVCTRCRYTGNSINFVSYLWLENITLLLHMSKYTILSNNKLCITDIYILFTYMTCYVLVVCLSRAFVVLPTVHNTMHALSAVKFLGWCCENICGHEVHIVYIEMHLFNQITMHGTVQRETFFTCC